MKLIPAVRRRLESVQDEAEAVRRAVAGRIDEYRLLRQVEDGVPEVDFVKPIRPKFTNKT
jgi:hypothetical protein